MEIIAHRGFWLDPSEKNSISAFKRALSNGFGIETDIRDYCGDLVVSHDIPNSGSLKFSDFLALAKNYQNQVLALNIKADGLQGKLIETDILDYKHFFFDMSVPDALAYQRENLNYYTRYSELETLPSLYETAGGIWFDQFYSSELNVDLVNKFLMDSKIITLVSPELHSFEYIQYWKQLKLFLNENSRFIDKVSLCTDYPLQAKEYFSGENT